MRNAILLFLFLISCNRCKDNNDILTPFPVNLQLNLNEPAYFALTGVTGWIYYNGSPVKLIIYRKSIDEFLVYDARAPYEVDNDCILSVQSDNTTIKDECSGSEWMMGTGIVSKGPANRNLLQYSNTFDQTFSVLSIYN